MNIPSKFIVDSVYSLLILIKNIFWGIWRTEESECLAFVAWYGIRRHTEKKKICSRCDSNYHELLSNKSSEISSLMYGYLSPPSDALILQLVNEEEFIKVRNQ